MWVWVRPIAHEVTEQWLQRPACPLTIAHCHPPMAKCTLFMLPPQTGEGGCSLSWGWGWGWAGKGQPGCHRPFRVHEVMMSPGVKGEERERRRDKRRRKEGKRREKKKEKKRRRKGQNRREEWKRWEEWGEKRRGRTRKRRDLGQNPHSPRVHEERGRSELSRLTRAYGVVRGTGSRGSPQGLSLCLCLPPPKLRKVCLNKNSKTDKASTLTGALDGSLMDVQGEERRR